MNAEEFREKLAEFVDGELSPSEAARMERKVAESPACDQLYRDMVALRERLRQLPREAPSAEFEFALRSQLLMEASKEGEAGRGKIRQLLFPSPMRSLLTGAAAAVVVLGAAALLQAPPPGSPVASGVNRARVADGPGAPSRSRLEYTTAPEAIERIERGALTTLSEEESIALSGRLYRNTVDSNASAADRIERRSRPAVPVGSRGTAKRVMVSF